MPDDFLDKVKYLCQKISQVEWSGVLFYEMEGSIKDPDNLVITLKDILPMDKGTKVYTEFDVDERFVTFLMDNPEHMEYKTGLIHSHNSMDVYFSGTDESELETNAGSHNFYLSLIVNNFMDFCAKIGFRGVLEHKLTQTPYKAQDEDGNFYDIQPTDFNLKQEVLFVYDCDVESTKEVITIPESFSEKVAKLLAPIKQVFPKKEVKTLPEKSSEKTESTLLEELILTTLNAGSIPAFFTCISTYLKVLSFNTEYTSEKVSDLFHTYYSTVYASLFDETTDEEFIKNTEKVIEMLEEHESSYAFVKGGILLLKGMLNLFEADING